MEPSTMSGAFHDLTKGYVPVALLLTFIIPTLIGIGIYFGRRDSSNDQLTTQISSLQTQVSALNTQVGQIAVNIAKGPTMPESVAYKADLLRFCVLNKNLSCPNF